jgi:hypothetical protein
MRFEAKIEPSCEIKKQRGRLDALAAAESWMGIQNERHGNG